LITGIVVGRAVRNLRQQSQQRAGDPDRVGVAQRGAGPAMAIHFGGAIRTQGNVMRGTQVCVHPQLTVDERRDGLGRQMLGGTELPRRTHRRVTLGGELGREPGERAAEHVTPLGHHQLLSVSRRAMQHYLECSALPDAEHQ
jgi:acetyl esterase/lipase